MSGDQTEFIKFARRILRALARRVEAADVEDLAEMIEIRGEVDAAIAHAVAGLHARGTSWSQIGRSLGITTQAAQKRYGRQPTVDAENAA